MRHPFAVTAVAALLAAAPALAAPEPLGIPAAPTRPVDQRVTKALARLPLSFEVNRGQAPEEFDFLVRCRGYHAFVASDAVVFSFGSAGLRMSLEGAGRCAPDTTGLSLPGHVSYFLGNDPEKWITKIPTTRGAVYADAAPGVSWRFGGDGRALEFEFELAAGVDGPRLAFDGAGAVTVGDDGALRLAMPDGVARISAPVAWQDIPGARLDARARWVVEKDGAVRIDVKPLDPSRGVRIDPSVTFSTYFGGSASDQAGGAAIDASGAAYFCATTQSTDFPTTTGAYSTTKNSFDTSYVRSDATVSKLSASGTSLVYSTYIGGRSDEQPRALAVDASGNAVFAGMSWSNDYPTTAGVYKFSASTGSGFVTKMNSTGTGLVFSTYTDSMVIAMAMTNAGKIYSIEGNGLSQYSANGTSQIAVTQIKPSSQFGGEGMEIAAVAADADGDAYVAGSTDMTNYYATSGAYQTSYAGRRDAFITKINSTGSVVYTTFLGGSLDESTSTVGVNLAEQVFVTGSTKSTNFPVTSGAYRTTNALIGDYGDSFLARLDSSGKTLRYATFLGFPSSPVICVHPGSSCVLVTSTYISTLATPDAFQNNVAGDTDCFLMKFNRDNTLAWASYWGGTAGDGAFRAGMAPDGSVVAMGYSSSTNLPTVSAYQSSLVGTTDMMLLTVPDTLPTNIAPTAVATDTLPTWTVGYAYSAPNLAASGGIGPYVWSKVSGSLPTGASLSTGGAITGTLTQTGTFTFRVHVEDTCEIAAEKQMTLTVNPPPSIASASMPQATIGTAYERTVPVVDGSGTMTFAITAGTAPPGTALATDGRLLGTPSQLGDFPFTVQVTDGRGATGSRQISLHVNDTPLVVADVVPPWTETRTFTMQFHGARGTSPFTWSHVGGTLPAATPLDPVLGRLSGPAMPADTYDFTLRVTDGAGAIAERTFTMTVNAMPAIAAATLPTAAVGRPYSATIPLSGGTPPYLWKINDGAIPLGLLLDGASGVVHGNLGGASAGPVTFVCSDRTGAVAEGAVTIPTAEFADLKKKRWSEKVVIAEGAPAPVVRYVELTAGAVLGIKVTGGGQVDAGPAAALVDSAGAAVDLAPWTRTTLKSLTVKGAVIAATGRYFLTVTPAPESKGKMTVSVTVSPRSAWTGGATLSPSTFADLDFSAPPGAQLAISAKATKGSAALPAIVSLVDAAGADLLAGGRVVAKGRATSFTSKTPLAGGDYRVRFSTRDANVGSIAWTVSVKLPRTYAFTMDAVPAGD